MSQDETEAIEWAKLMKRIDDMEKAIRDIDIEIEMVRNTLLQGEMITKANDALKKEVKSTC